MEDLEIYFNSLYEGDNITVTADLLDAMEKALNFRDNFFKRQVQNYIESLAEPIEVTEEQVEKIAELVENDDEVWQSIDSSIDWYLNKVLDKE